MDDLMAVRDEIAKQIKKANNKDLSNMVSFVWTPIKTNQQLDFLWFDMHANMNALGRASDAFVASGGEAAVGALAAQTAECAAGIVTHEQIYEPSEPLGGDDGPVIVESFVCELHEGKTIADARAAVNNWQGAIESLGIYDDYVAYMQTPVVSQFPANLYYFAGHSNMTDYAARVSAYSTSAAGVEADRRFNEVHRCTSALWSGQLVIGSMQ